jgi:hypothetical protein
MPFGGALASISISNTLSPSYGTIDYSVQSDGTKSGNYVITENQGASSTLVKVEGVNVYGANYFDGDIAADTNYGDHAETHVEFTGSSDVKVDNFNLYGYLTPNLAWTGQFTGSVKAEYIDFGYDSSSSIGDGYDEAWTRDETDGPQGYQSSTLYDGIYTYSPSADPDFTASNVYTTNQAGGSYDPTEFDVGQSSYAKSWGGQGTYAMSNLEYGSFSIASTTRAPDEYWVIGDPYVYSDDFQGSSNYIEAWSADDQYFEYGPLTFTVNTPAMNYADADIAYSNTDFGVKGYAGAEMDQEEAGAEWYYYFPHTDRYTEDYAEQEYIPLSTFQNVFSYGYVNVPQNIVKADVVFY